METRHAAASESWKQLCFYNRWNTTLERVIFFLHQLLILHLSFPSQPCGHKGSSISVNRIKSSIDPASHSILQDTPCTGLNKASKPLNLTMLAKFNQDIRKTLPSPVKTTWGSCLLSLQNTKSTVARQQYKLVFKLTFHHLSLGNIKKYASHPAWFVCSKYRMWRHRF